MSHLLTTNLRGHKIYTDDGQNWFYSDTNEPTDKTYKTRPCGRCGLPPTPEGHDACLGTLPGVRNACCGHGENASAYVQFDKESNRTTIRGTEAINFFYETNQVKL